MPDSPNFLARILTHTGDTVGVVIVPRKCIIKSEFGAGKRRCWLELHQESSQFPVQLGMRLEIDINGWRCFNGRITERRLDSIDDPLTLYATWDPEREYDFPVAGLFQNQTIGAILQEILTKSSLSWSDPSDYLVKFSRLEFAGESVFTAIDLLAKLAGNWIWDIDDAGLLRFRPHATETAHHVLLELDRYQVNLWETNHDLYAVIQVRGGSVEGTTYTKWIQLPEFTPLAEQSTKVIYVRPMTTSDVFYALQRTVKEQMNQVHYEHVVDLYGQGVNIQAGDCIRFNAPYMPLFPSPSFFRVKMREITYAHEELQVRLHLTSRFESSRQYFEYFRSDRRTSAATLPGRSGLFQLDISSLDSASHLDAA